MKNKFITLFTILFAPYKVLVVSIVLIIGMLLRDLIVIEGVRMFLQANIVPYWTFLNDTFASLMSIIFVVDIIRYIKFVWVNANNGTECFQRMNKSNWIPIIFGLLLAFSQYIQLL